MMAMFTQASFFGLEQAILTALYAQNGNAAQVTALPANVLNGNKVRKTALHGNVNVMILLGAAGLCLVIAPVLNVWKAMANRRAVFSIMIIGTLRPRATASLVRIPGGVANALNTAAKKSALNGNVTAWLKTAVTNAWNMAERNIISMCSRKIFPSASVALWRIPAFTRWRFLRAATG